jgi:hypothetical protein
MSWVDKKRLLLLHCPTSAVCELAPAVAADRLHWIDYETDPKAEPYLVVHFRISEELDPGTFNE